MTRLLDGEKSFVRSLHVVWSSQQEWCQREKLALKGSPKFWRIISFTLPEIWRLANFLLHAIWRHMPFLPLRCHVVSLLALVLCASKAFPRHHWMVFRDMELLAHPVAFVPNDLFILRFQSVSVVSLPNEVLRRVSVITCLWFWLRQVMVDTCCVVDDSRAHLYKGFWLSHPKSNEMAGTRNPWNKR